MIDLDQSYGLIRNVHITAAIASGTLFLARGVGVNLLGAAWPMSAPVRYSSYAIDTVLLGAAMLLMAITSQYPFQDAWLTVKVLLVVVYIVLGSFALRRARSRPARLGFLVAAAAVFGFVVSIARAHDPLGLFSGM